MKRLAATVMSLSLLVSAGAFAGQGLAAEAENKPQTISRAGSQASVKGPAEYFTGYVRIDPCVRPIFVAGSSLV
jgi:hypothetical protein